MEFNFFLILYWYEIQAYLKKIFFLSYFLELRPKILV